MLIYYFYHFIDKIVTRDIDLDDSDLVLLAVDIASSDYFAVNWLHYPHVFLYTSSFLDSALTRFASGRISFSKSNKIMKVDRYHFTYPKVVGI